MAYRSIHLILHSHSLHEYNIQHTYIISSVQWRYSQPVVLHYEVIILDTVNYDSELIKQHEKISAKQKLIYVRFSAWLRIHSQQLQRHSR